MIPASPVIERYNLLIEELAKNTEQNLGAIGDSHFEGVRFYTCDRVDGCFNYDQTTETGADKVNQIEGLLMQAEEPVLLFAPILAKLKTVALEFNRKGKYVFLASWGMGPGEVGWCIRYLNEFSLFERYLTEAGITEAEVDLYNKSYEEELRAADIL